MEINRVTYFTDKSCKSLSEFEKYLSGLSVRRRSITVMYVKGEDINHIAVGHLLSNSEVKRILGLTIACFHK